MAELDEKDRKIRQITNALRENLGLPPEEPRPPSRTVFDRMAPSGNTGVIGGVLANNLGYNPERQTLDLGPVTLNLNEVRKRMSQDVQKPRSAVAGPVEAIPPVKTTPAVQPDNTPPPVVSQKAGGVQTDEISPVVAKAGGVGRKTTGDIESIMPWKKYEKDLPTLKIPATTATKSPGGVVNPAVKEIAARYASPTAEIDAANMAGEEAYIAQRKTIIGGRPASDIEGLIYTPTGDGNVNVVPYFKQGGVGKPLTSEELKAYESLPPLVNTTGTPMTGKEAMTTPDVWSGPRYIPGTASTPEEQEQAKAMSQANLLSRITKSVPYSQRGVAGKTAYEKHGMKEVPDYGAQVEAAQKAEAGEAKAPKTIKVNEGAMTNTMQWDPETKEWVTIATAPRSIKGAGAGKKEMTDAQYRTTLKDYNTATEKVMKQWRNGEITVPQANNEINRIVEMYEPLFNRYHGFTLKKKSGTTGTTQTKESWRDWE